MAALPPARILERFFGVRRREVYRIVPLTSAYGLVMASLYILKPARNALFLDRLGIEQLPFVLILVAAIGAGAALAFTRFTAALRIDRLVISTYLVLIVCLIGFRVLLPHQWSWSYYLFYVWVNIYGLLATSLIWLLANAVFNAREGRRLFGLIGTAGILGAVIGGIFTSWAVNLVGTENLLLVCAAVLGLCLLALYPVRVREAVSKAGEDEGGGVLDDIKRSELVQMLGGVAALVAMVAAIIDVQFNQIVDEAFPSTDGKTAFFAQFFAALSAFAFLFQLVITPRVMRSWGVTSALLFLPLSMALGSFAVLFVPGLLAGVLVKFGDGAFRHSIHRSATEILYLPIPADIKRRVKVLLDTTVDNLATGVGAVLVLIALNLLGVSYQHLSFLSLGLIVLWFGVSVRSRRAYVDAFRQALERREIDLGEYTVDLTEAAAMDSIMKVLDSPNERRIIYGLDMLSGISARRLVEPVSALLSHPSGEVRARALEVLQNQESEGLPLAQIDALQFDADLQVRVEALYCMCLHGDGDRGERLRTALAHADLRLRQAAVGCIAGHGTEEEHGLIDEAFIRQLFADAEGDIQVHVQAARLVGTVPDSQRPYVQETIRQLMEMPDAPVVAQTIESFGQLRDPQHLSWLLDQLDDRRFRRAAREALARFGVEVLPVLGARLADEGLEMPKRLRAARVMAEIVEQETVDRLLANLGEMEPRLQYGIIKSLSKLRNKSARLQFASRDVDAALRQAAKAYVDQLQILALHEGEGGAERGAGVRLLVKALAEKRREQVKRIFRLLALSHPPKDMYNAYLGYVSGERATRASALEFLENVLDRDMKELLMPLLEMSSVSAAIDHGQRVFGTRFAGVDDALEFLLADRDPWIKACATYSLTAAQQERYGEHLRRLAQDRHPVVCETAMLIQLGSSAG